MQRLTPVDCDGNAGNPWATTVESDEEQLRRSGELTRVGGGFGSFGGFGGGGGSGCGVVIVVIVVAAF